MTSHSPAIVATVVATFTIGSDFISAGIIHLARILRQHIATFDRCSRLRQWLPAPTRNSDARPYNNVATNPISSSPQNQKHLSNVSREPLAAPFAAVHKGCRFGSVASGNCVGHWHVTGGPGSMSNQRAAGQPHGGQFISLIAQLHHSAAKIAVRPLTSPRAVVAHTVHHSTKQLGIPGTTVVVGMTPPTLQASLSGPESTILSTLVLFIFMAFRVAGS